MRDRDDDDDDGEESSGLPFTSIAHILSLCSLHMPPPFDG